MRIYSIIIFCTFVILSVSVSCSTQDPFQDVKKSPSWSSSELNCSLTFETLTSESRNNEDSYTPQNGDMMMLCLNSISDHEIKEIAGYAVYDATQGSWLFHYYGHLNDCSTTRCTVAYIGNNPTLTEDKTSVLFDHYSPVYFCEDGTYSYDSRNNVLSLLADLAPQTGRIRFQNVRESTLDIKGVYAFNELAHSNGRWYADNYTPRTIELTASDDTFYSRYCYCLPNNTPLLIKDGESVYRWSKEIKDYLKIGKTGLIQLPSVNADDWACDSYRIQNVPNITIPYDSSGGWTQTQDQTRIYSNVGINVQIYFIITRLTSQQWTNYPFTMGVWAYDSDGNYVNSWERGFHKKDIFLNEEMYHVGDYYDADANYYEIKFYHYQLEANITEVEISTF